ncbi:CheR family methyltransferase [Marinobacterium arenosum]|uniref:CheR family methyltransferase n=1 Tax=Marinobacterium arenosum TaxID=2862496 RepID=UPI001C97800D|nr:CheR family methyltransferase [Marinobacterium arenosum]MBY4677290.1 hypothetical protein [Marinobacterium arenosum]
MNDRACIDFLQWSLPRLHYRWRGFRKVRRQVCRRLQLRLTALGLDDLDAYRRYLQQHPQEWPQLDRCCDISVTHFYRDRRIFQLIGQRLLPELASRATAAGRRSIHCWSLGCCSGDEPYTLSLIWHCQVLPSLSTPIRLQIIASDRNALFLQRARDARYSGSSLKELPADFVERGFRKEGSHYRLKERYRNSVEFRQQDIRNEQPDDRFELICCRNQALTYFDTELQQAVLTRICDRLRCGGYLVVGAHEQLPPGDWPLLPHPDSVAIWQKSG